MQDTHVVAQPAAKESIHRVPTNFDWTNPNLTSTLPSQEVDPQAMKHRLLASDEGVFGTRQNTYVAEPQEE